MENSRHKMAANGLHLPEGGDFGAQKDVNTQKGVTAAIVFNMSVE